jgi:hypothetical protein
VASPKRTARSTTLRISIDVELWAAAAAFSVILPRATHVARINNILRNRKQSSGTSFARGAADIPPQQANC